ncbi:hypothetical protein PCE1_000728 [Barthelona sp. PCE]
MTVNRKKFDLFGQSNGQEEDEFEILDEEVDELGVRINRIHDMSTGMSVDINLLENEVNKTSDKVNDLTGVVVQAADRFDRVAKRCGCSLTCLMILVFLGIYFFLYFLYKFLR